MTAKEEKAEEDKRRNEIWQVVSKSLWNRGVIHSGVSRIFRPMSKLSLCRKNTMGKMGKVFIDRSKLFWLNKVESISLITTVKNYFHLFNLLHGYFTLNQKYFYIWMILGFSSFKWYIKVCYQTCYHGEISGLRSRSLPVVIRYRFPNSDAKLNFSPNNDAPPKYKHKLLLKKKTFFSRFQLGKAL